MKTLLACSLLLLFGVGRAQQSGDSVRHPHEPFVIYQQPVQRAVDPIAVYNNNPSDRVRGSFAPWIVPAGLITYGFFGTRIDAFTDVNEDVQHHIWVAHPHRTLGIDNVLPFVPAVAVYGLNIAGIKGEHDLFDRSMLLFLSGAITGVSTFGVKSLVHEDRPDHSAFNSFPSGHTAAAFATAEFLMQEYKHESVWYGIGGYVVAASVGYLRLYNNKHWVNDVVAGAGFGIASTRLAYLLYPKIQKALSKTRFNHSMIVPYYQNNSVGFSFSHQFR